jgi:glycosyltransferase involved in cell wall biosynthesis
MSSAADSINPALLRYGENLISARALACLRWAQRVIVLDSGSTDGTGHVARSFTKRLWYTRRFDSHGSASHAALFETSIDTDYALALDADMQIPPQFQQEVNRRFPPGNFDGSVVHFYTSLAGIGSLSGYTAPTRLFGVPRGVINGRPYS